MRVSEHHPAGRQLVEVRCGDLAPGIVGLEVAVAHVVGENEYDVG